jgi:hypothetical protein
VCIRRTFRKRFLSKVHCIVSVAQNHPLQGCRGDIVMPDVDTATGEILHQFTKHLFLGFEVRLRKTGHDFHFPTTIFIREVWIIAQDAQ